MKLKLFKVDVETFFYVLAKDKEAAKKVADNELFSNPSDMLDGYNIYARELKTANEILSYGKYWGEPEPYMSKKDENDPENKELLNLTCKEIMALIEEDRKRAEDRAYAESLQIKFPFMEACEAKMS